MYCRACEYPLDGTTGGVCPECGRAFDPSSAATFDREPGGGTRARVGAWVGRGAIAAGSVPLAANVLAYAAFVVARLSLGRWPQRYGMDDPNDCTWALLYIPAMLLLVMSIPALLVTAVLVCVLAAMRLPSKMGWYVVTAGCLWAVGFALMRWDPIKVWVWMFD